MAGNSKRFHGDNQHGSFSDSEGSEEGRLSSKRTRNRAARNARKNSEFNLTPGTKATKSRSHQRGPMETGSSNHMAGNNTNLGVGAITQFGGHGKKEENSDEDRKWEEDLIMYEKDDNFRRLNDASRAQFRNQRESEIPQITQLQIQLQYMIQLMEEAKRLRNEEYSVPPLLKFLVGHHCRALYASPWIASYAPNKATPVIFAVLRQHEQGQLPHGYFHAVRIRKSLIAVVKEKLRDARAIITKQLRVYQESDKDAAAFHSFVDSVTAFDVTIHITESMLLWFGFMIWFSDSEIGKEALSCTTAGKTYWDKLNLELLDRQKQFRTLCDKAQVKGKGRKGAGDEANKKKFVDTFKNEVMNNLQYQAVNFVQDDYDTECPQYDMVLAVKERLSFWSAYGGASSMALIVAT